MDPGRSSADWSEPAELDGAVEALNARQVGWAREPVAARIDLLRRCGPDWVREAEGAVAAGCRAKGLDLRSPSSAEEWLGGPVTILRNIRLLIETLSAIRRTGRPWLPDGAVRRLAGGGLTVDVFPRDRLDRALYPGVRVEVWQQPGIHEANLADSMAVAYRDGDARDGATALVLGAGNVMSIGPSDVLYKMFVEKRVVVLKMHPVNEYLGPFIERGFRALIDAGLLRVVYGGAAEGQHLAHHRGVHEIHMTGSAAVHDRIVWGDTAEEQARRRAGAAPRVRKPISSELGCVTPVIVVPGEWSPGEIAYQAENVASMVVTNASCNCNAAKAIVTWRGWAQRGEFLARVAQVLSRVAPRKAYYPGSLERFQRYVEAYPTARCLGSRIDDRLPCATIFDLDAASAAGLAFQEEAWAPVIAEVGLSADDEAHFLDEAVRFCNDRVAGTLSAVVIADPRARRRLRGRFDEAIAGLRYGTVAINHWSAMSFVLAVPPWGAFPGHTLEQVGSGIGVVHNTLMFDRPQKTVLWGPFTASPKPPWFCTHRRGHVVARRLVAFEAAPAWWRVPGLAVPAFRS
jgi:acyl-CoA reductase-like NAD-dependent aldehyde dehydrogenase